MHFKDNRSPSSNAIVHSIFCLRKKVGVDPGKPGQLQGAGPVVTGGWGATADSWHPRPHPPQYWGDKMVATGEFGKQ